MTAKRKPVEAWAWAVVAPESDTLIFWDPVGAMDAAAEVDGGEVIDLVPRTERSPAEAAVIRAAMKWWDANRVDDYAKQDDANNALDSAIKRLRRGTK
jgi:hypothetical protein